MYKGFKKNVAIDGNFSAYEFILEGLLRLQIGFDKKMIETGILLLTSKRSENSPYGSTSRYGQGRNRNVVSNHLFTSFNLSV